ncbi:MAG: transglutaminase domain-containing protein [Alistipes sp.]|nr:transglutaminase domain-containing protein [Alistipes sp.]
MKKILLLSLAVMALFGASAQTPEWRKQLDRLDKEADQLYEEKKWKKLVANQEQYRKVFMSLPGSVRQEHFWDTDLSGNYYYNLACWKTLAGDKKGALKTFEYYTDRVIDSEEIRLTNINHDSDLDAIRQEPRFKACMERLAKWGDYKQKLKDAKQYHSGLVPDGFKFRYAAPNDPDLVKIREHFKLDSVAGAGDEISKIKNLLHWVHEIVPHDGSSYNPEVKNTIAMVELCKKENRGVNCRMMAQMLTEVYLAMGFKARFVTCLPKDYVSDCHVITTVYSNTLNKWLWVDPTFDAYVMDENGTMLSIAEVRERLREDKPLQLNDYANWNHKSKQTKEYYIDHYMAKNLYHLVCMEWARFNHETAIEGQTYRYIALMPYDEINSKSSAINWNDLRICDDKLFWQSPYEE